MKLLLTSSGLTNNSIANALFSLTGKKPEETTVVRSEEHTSELQSH